jgi:integrase
MKSQQGYIWRVGRSWYGRWYRDEIKQGARVRRQHSEKLAEFGDHYRSEKDVKPLLAEKLKEVNEGRCPAESTLTIVKYFDGYFLPYAESELKASTVHGYRGLFRMYLRHQVANVSLRDFTCGQATKLLVEIYREHKLSKKSLRHVKGLLQSIFTLAKRQDVLFGENPIKDAGYPRAAKAANKSHAYTVQEMTSMLHTLTGTAKAAVAIMYFAGLRPGEARGMKWSDYDADKRVLNVQRSIWRKHESGPKTEGSVAPVPVAEALRAILEETPRTSEFILATPSGKPVDLHNLARRVITPALDLCGACHKPQSEHEKASHEFERDPLMPEWKGFYALRRGIATALADMDNAIAAKSVLRHSNVSTTTAHYVKSIDAAAVRGISKVSALFEPLAGRPI